MLKRLEWMTDKNWEDIEFHWGCVCDYEKVWGDDYEGWCKRVLELPRYNRNN